MGIQIKLPTDLPLGEPAGPLSCRAMQRGQTVTLTDHDTYLEAALDAPMAASAVGVPCRLHGVRLDKSDMQAHLRATLVRTPDAVARWQAEYGGTTPAARATALVGSVWQPVACAGLGVLLQTVGWVPTLTLLGAGWLVRRHAPQIAAPLQAAVSPDAWRWGILACAALGGREIEVPVPAAKLREGVVATVDQMRGRIFDMLPKLREMDAMFNLSRSTLHCGYDAPAGGDAGDVAALHVTLQPDETKFHNCVHGNITVRAANAAHTVAVAGTWDLQDNDRPVLTGAAPTPRPPVTKTASATLQVRPCLSPPPSLAPTHALIDTLRGLQLDGRICLRDTERDVASHIRFIMRARAWVTISTVPGRLPSVPTEFHIVPDKDAIMMRACLKKHVSPTSSRRVLTRERVRMSPKTVAERAGHTIAQHIKSVFEAPGVEMTALQRLVFRPEYLRAGCRDPYMEIHLSGMGKMIPHGKLPVHGVLFVHHVEDSAHVTAHVDEAAGPGHPRLLHVFVPRGYVPYFMGKLTFLLDLGRAAAALIAPTGAAAAGSLDLSCLMPEGTHGSLVATASGTGRTLAFNADVDNHELQLQVTT